MGKVQSDKIKKVRVFCRRGVKAPTGNPIKTYGRI